MRLRTLPLLLAASIGAFVLPAQQAPKPGHGIQPSFMDTSVKSGDDFYRYANGTWLRTSSIPAEYPRWGSFIEVYDRNMKMEKELVEAAAKDDVAPAGSITRMVGDFYAAGMDEAAIEKAGLQPLKPLLGRIEGMKDATALADVLGELHDKGLAGGFSMGVEQDDKDATQRVVTFGQGGLGLPDRDYYTREDDKSKALRLKYVDHVARMLELLGDKPELAKQHAATVLAMETRLAKASMTNVEQRDPNAIYHKMSREQFLKDAPGFAWNPYFKALGMPAAGDLLIRQPVFMAEFAKMAKDTPLPEWKTYLRWHLVRSTAPYLGNAFVQENFAFYSATLRGTKALSPRWKRVLSASDAVLGEAVGRLYVEKHFSPEAKRKMLEMIGNLQAALGERIKGLEWMSEATKQKALGKLAAFGVKVGYPDTWRSWSGLKIARGSYLGNVLRANAFESQRQMARIGKPIDRSEWDINPHMVNAFYSPNMNEICFPAGILQPPFFDPEADDACNYGGIGMAIGHEMTHGFDDSGCQYDAKGNLQNWWTEADTKAFESRQAKVVQQFDGYKALPDLAVNGKLTLGENIADLGGLKIAFEALKKQWAKTGKPGPIDGFTAEQRFFLSYGQVWRNLCSDEFLRVQVNTDPHSPANFRVMGPLSNMPEFFEAFGVPEGAPMRRPAELRPTIW